MNKIAIIIPAFNEKDNLPELVNKIKILHANAEIYIIDDSSENFIEINFKNKDYVKYFFRGKKLGRGSAVIFGLKEALKKDYSIFIEMDADFSHDPNELQSKISYFNETNSDMLIASRYLKNSKIINWTLPRKIFSKLSNVLARILLKIPVSDYTNGQIYSKRAAQKLLTNVVT